MKQIKCIKNGTASKKYLKIFQKKESVGQIIFLPLTRPTNAKKYEPRENQFHILKKIILTERVSKMKLAGIAMKI